MNNIVEANQANKYTCPNLVSKLAGIYAEPYNQQELEKAFDEIASLLLRHTKIVTPKAEFYLKEIEFYFNDEKDHRDPYSHHNPRQMTFGEWYFHRFGSAVTFRKSRRNGIDVTFGNEQDKITGGILIRKLQKAESSDIIVGINRCVSALIENMTEEEIHTLATGTGQSVFDKTSLMRLEETEANSKEAIFKTERFNLSEKNHTDRDQYFYKQYCYFNHGINQPMITKVKDAS